MELREYLDAARRSWMLILGTALAVVAVTAGVTFALTPQYASTSRVFIATRPSPNSEVAYQGGLFSQQRASSYAEVLSGQELSRKVIKALDLKVSAPDLSKQINASVVPSTVVLKITVTDSSAKQAQRINNAVVAQLQSFVQTLETPAGRKAVPLLTANVVDAPDLASSAVSPNRVRNLGLAAVVGLLLGFGLAMLRDRGEQGYASHNEQVSG